MGNLEKSMKAVAASLTGKQADAIPENLEGICLFIAENYKAPASQSVPFKQVKAPSSAAAAPTQEEFNTLIEKLKEAKIFI